MNSAELAPDLAVDLTAAFGQYSHRVRFEWGPTGARAVRRDRPLLVAVVDVLSFTTGVSVVLDNGGRVYPFRWRDGRAEEYAASLGVPLARAARERDLSLSPASLRAATDLDAIVLPSPNGSTVSAELSEAGARVVAACLRNATATGDHLADFLAQDTTHEVAVVAAGERWTDGTLRPAIEDLWGAGAVLRRLPAVLRSPEAEVAVAAYQAMRPGDLHACSSGQELIVKGFAEDVDIAAEVDSSTVVAVLREAAFEPLR